MNRFGAKMAASRMANASGISRREFLTMTGLALAGAGCAALPRSEPIIDIHQHANYGGKRGRNFHQIGPARSNAQLIAHQRNMGATTTIMLPAGSPVIRPSTHEGLSNGLEGTCTGNDACRAIALEHPREFYFAANEVPDLASAPATIEKYLQLGALCIAEQKFGVECDSAAMRRLYSMAAEYNVPVLMHWQFGRYNYGYERLYKLLENYPRTIFIGHAQTVWAHIDGNYVDDVHNLYPTGPVAPGGWTDRYLADYPNFYADVSAESGHTGLTRDPGFTHGFMLRHQEKLLFGSDCSDRVGHGVECTGWSTIQSVRRLAPSKRIERKILYENARRLYRF